MHIKEEFHHYYLKYLLKMDFSIELDVFVEQIMDLN